MRTICRNWRIIVKMHAMPLPPSTINILTHQDKLCRCNFLISISTLSKFHTSKCFHAGMCHCFMVWVVSMVWLQNLVTWTLLNTLHVEDEDDGLWRRSCTHKVAIMDLESPLTWQCVCNFEGKWFIFSFSLFSIFIIILFIWCHLPSSWLTI